MTFLIAFSIILAGHANPVVTKIGEFESVDLPKNFYDVKEWETFEFEAPRFRIKFPKGSAANMGRMPKAGFIRLHFSSWTIGQTPEADGPCGSSHPEESRRLMNLYLKAKSNSDANALAKVAFGRLRDDGLKVAYGLNACFGVAESTDPASYFEAKAIFFAKETMVQLYSGVFEAPPTLTVGESTDFLEKFGEVKPPGVTWKSWLAFEKMVNSIELMK